MSVWQLETNNNFRQISLGDSRGLSHPPNFKASLVVQEDNQVQINGTKSLIIRLRQQWICCKRSSKGGPGSGRSVLVNNVCGKAIEENTTNFQLKDLNNYVETQKFKLESLDLVKTILKPNDYLMKLDLKDAHYSVPKHKSAGNTFDSNFKV